MADNEKLNLLADFAPVSAQQWKDKIIADLKGASADNKFLVWCTHGRLLTASMPGASSQRNGKSGLRLERPSIA